MNSTSPKQTLKKYFGYDSFRPLQENIIQTILNGQDCLAIIPTGGGKSLCFQIPGLILEGTTIVISPLISLMEDQVQQLQKRGICAVQLSSSLSKEKRAEVEKQIESGSAKFIYLSPEQLQTKKWQLLSNNLKIKLVVVDEAHCISQWGHDFRPPYRTISNWVSTLSHRPTIAAFTATATKQTENDIISSLQLIKPIVVREESLPEHLWWFVLSCSDDFHRWVRLFQVLQKHLNQSGIIYTLTRKSTEEITTIISNLFPSIKTAFYHGGMSAIDRQRIQEQFIDNQIDLIVATNAFGMGVDKPNIRFVIHFHTPNSIEAYIQEVGRAGRDRKEAWCYLLNQQKNQKINLDLIGDDERKKEKYKWLQSLLSSKNCLKKNSATYFSINFREVCHKCSKCALVKVTNTESKKYFQELLQLRKNIAKKTNLKPSFVLTQKQAAMIALFKPKNIQQFSKIPGFGQGWIEKIWPLLENDRIYQERITKESYS